MTALARLRGLRVPVDLPPASFPPPESKEETRRRSSNPPSSAEGVVVGRTVRISTPPPEAASHLAIPDERSVDHAERANRDTLERPPQRATENATNSVGGQEDPERETVPERKLQRRVPPPLVPPREPEPDIEPLDLDEADFAVHEEEPISEPPPGPVSATASPAQNAPSQKAKKRTRPWFETFFNDDYLRTVRQPKPSQIAKQCDFVEQALSVAKGSTVLDLACGLGSQAIELSRRGYSVVGIDLSLPMLSRASEAAADAAVNPSFLHGDMRELALLDSFDAVLSLGTSFGYFDDESNRNVASRIFSALKPHGVLLLEIVNRDFVIRSQPNLVWFEGDACVCMEETSFNSITSRLHVKRTVILDDGRQRESEYSLRLYSLHEIGQLLHQAGFRVTRVSGREATPGVFFGADSPKLIVLAERPLES